MKILILTGPPGCGKNTVSALLAQRRSQCAVIDVDAVRQMVVQPHKAPWDGDEGIVQAKLGVENACLLARQFVQTGFDGVILDVIWRYTLPIYQERLADYSPKFVLLMPELTETLRRNAARGWLPAHEVVMIYEEIKAFTEYDRKIDNTNLKPDVLAAMLARFMDG